MLRTLNLFLHKILLKKFLLSCFIAGVLATVVLATGTFPTLSQTPFQESSLQTNLNQDIWLDLKLLFRAAVGKSLETQGNLKEGWIFLDSTPLFRVSAPNLPHDPDNPKGISQIQWRINEIEHNLAEIVDEKDFNPAEIDVRVEQLNNQPVIFAVGDSWKIMLLTITDKDWQSDDTTQSIEELSQKRVQIIKAALTRAYQERQSDNLRQEAFNTLKILSILVGASLAISLIAHLANVAFNRFETRQQSSLEHLKLQRRETKKTIDNQLSNGDRGTKTQSDSQSKVDTSDTSSKFEQNIVFRLSQAKILRSFLRDLLLGMQILLWLGGITWIFYLFYATRSISRILISVPFTIILILVVLSLLKYSSDFLFSYGLGRWSNRQISGENSQRLLLRIPTLNVAFSSSTSLFLLIIGILWFLKIYNVPLLATFAGISLLGFGFQDLIQDFIQGVFILWEDQYTQGDIVKIGDYFGEVELFNLRATQLRTLDGEVVTIAHSSFKQVINYTKHWSRLNLDVEVAYNTDLDKAIGVIGAIAQELCHDPQWQQRILEQPKVLGVDAFGDNSITIRLLIKTQPRQQWEVGREYRRRLKIAFDQAGISIPFPQRSIWFETPLISCPVEQP